MPRYKLRDANGATRVLTLDEQASYADLVASCGGASYTLKAGRPPTTLTCEAPSTTPCAAVVRRSLITAENRSCPPAHPRGAAAAAGGKCVRGARAAGARDAARRCISCSGAKSPASAVDLPDVHVHQRRGLLRDRGRHGVMQRLRDAPDKRRARGAGAAVADARYGVTARRRRRRQLFVRGVGLFVARRAARSYNGKSNRTKNARRLRFRSRGRPH